MADLICSPIPKHPCFKNLVGQTFGDWTVISFGGKRCGNPIWNCRCVCGKEVAVLKPSLVSRKSKGCGCRQYSDLAKRLTRHGMAKRSGRHPCYSIWKNIKARCCNPQSSKFKYYGGRGIKMCNRWQQSFTDFVADMGDRPTPQHTVERKDTNGDYCPENCTWATMREQTRNKRSNRFFTFNGETLCVNDWAARLGIKTTTMQARFKVMPIEQALALPVTPQDHEGQILIDLNGKTQNLARWCKELGLNYASTQSRIFRGWSATDALTIPKRHKSPKC